MSLSFLTRHIRSFCESVRRLATLKFVAAVERLSAAGFGISIGVGYSSLGYLQLLPVDELKIDRQFTRDLLVDGGVAAIVESVVGLGARLGIRTVVEGIETVALRV